MHVYARPLSSEVTFIAARCLLTIELDECCTYFTFLPKLFRFLATKIEDCKLSPFLKNWTIPHDVVSRVKKANNKRRGYRKDTTVCGYLIQ